MEDINSKAHQDELNKSQEEISDVYSKQNTFIKCSKCGRMFDLRLGGKSNSSVNLCKVCSKK